MIDGLVIIIYLYQTILKQMLIAPLKRYLNIIPLNHTAFCTSAKPTKLFQSLMVCPQAALQKYLREMSKLSDDHMKICLDILIARMSSDEIKQPLILNPVYASYIKRFPLYQFHAHLQMIGLKLNELDNLHEQKKEKEQKMKIVEINSIYTLAFESLRRLSKQQMEREEPYLLHSFASYHSNVLAEMVKDEQVEPTLKKAVEILKKLMNRCVILLEAKEKEYGDDFQYTPEEIEKLKAFERLLQNKKTIPNVQRQAIDKHYNTPFYMRYTYTSFYAKSVIELMDLVNRLSHPKANARKEVPNIDIHPGLFEMTPALQQALQLYRKMGDERAYDPHYFPIRKLVIELLYQQGITRVHAYQIPEMKAQYFQLLQDLQEQILVTLGQLTYKEQDYMTLLSSYEVLYKITIMLKEEALKKSLEYNEMTFKDALEETFHELVVTLTDKQMKDMVGMHLLGYIEEQYGIDFLTEFQREKEKRPQITKKMLQQSQPQVKQRQKSQPLQQIPYQKEKSKARASKSHRNPIKPSDLQ